MNSHADDARPLSRSRAGASRASSSRAFASVDPGVAYQHNWHVDAIARALEQAARGEVTRLIITLPPRSFTSAAVPVAVPACLPCHNPRQRFLAVSDAEALAEKRALDCLKVLEAP